MLKGFPNILETCQQWIMEKVSLLKQMSCDGLPLQIDTSCSLEGFPYTGLISSLTTLQNHIVICDIGICSLLDDFYRPFYVNIFYRLCTVLISFCLFLKLDRGFWKLIENLVSLQTSSFQILGSLVYLIGCLPLWREFMLCKYVY